MSPKEHIVVNKYNSVSIKNYHIFCLLYFIIFCTSEYHKCKLICSMLQLDILLSVNAKKIFMFKDYF